VRDTLDDLGLEGMVSSGHAGLEGIGTSLAEADQVAALVASHPGLLGASAVRYSDVMLDLLLLRDARLAEDFVNRTLGSLAAATPEAARLCETVDTWMRHGSHVAAAEDLGVHEQTVRNRLARAETLVGGSLRVRRTEVEVALRLRRLLAAAHSAET
jgi:DNA-binding PucR family transcriptional regulator